MQLGQTPRLPTIAMEIAPSRRLDARRAIALRVAGAIALGVVIWFWPLGRPKVEVPPSFDCLKAVLPTEKTICADPQLAKIDADFALYYQDNVEVVANFGDSAKMDALEKSERDFRDARNQCGAAKWCIERMYAARDRQLTDSVGAPHRPTLLRRTREHCTYIGAYLLGHNACTRRAR